MARQFSFDNAMLHFARADGPRGFLWKYLLTFLIATVAMMALGYVAVSPWLSIGAADAASVDRPAS